MSAPGVTITFHNFVVFDAFFVSNEETKAQRGIQGGCK